MESLSVEVSHEADLALDKAWTPWKQPSSNPQSTQTPKWWRNTVTSICTPAVLSLFLEVGVQEKIVENKIQSLVLGCQPDVNANRFLECKREKDNNTMSSNSVPTFLFLYGTISKPASIHGVSDRSLLRPMQVLDPSLATLSGSPRARSIETKDLEGAFHILIHEGNDLNLKALIPEGLDKKQRESPIMYFLALLSALQYTHPLNDEKSWQKLLFRLVRHGSILLPEEEATAFLKGLEIGSFSDLRFITMLAFASIIKAKAAFLVGEAKMLVTKHTLCNVPLATDRRELEILDRHDDEPNIESLTSGLCPLQLLVSDSSLPYKAHEHNEMLKLYSHHQLQAFSKLRVSSLMDFVMDYALERAEAEGSDKLSDATTASEYKKKLSEANQHALDMIRKTSSHNQHLHGILQTYSDKHKNATAGSDQDQHHHNEALSGELSGELGCRLSSSHVYMRGRKVLPTSPKTINWLVSLLTQWTCTPNSAHALFDLLQGNGASKKDNSMVSPLIPILVYAIFPHIHCMHSYLKHSWDHCCPLEITRVCSNTMSFIHNGNVFLSPVMSLPHSCTKN
jgi:hypothetical protein